MCSWVKLYFFCNFSLTIGTINIWYVSISWTSIFIWYLYYRNPVHTYKYFLLTTHEQDQTSALILHTDNGSDIYWYSSFRFIIQILLTDCDHWIFDIIQIPTCFFNLLALCSWFPRIWAYNIGWYDVFAWSYPENYWLHTQVNHLVLQSKFRALLNSEVVNFITKTPRSGVGKFITLIGYSSWLI